ncbi:MAG: hypothetical protein LWW75_02260 [Chlorobiales bacterium]|nr:hypothetical protein [Chlorobiales bacterium]
MILSVIVVEMRFRSARYRALEYFFWVFLWVFRRKRIKLLSVGVAQIQLRYWQKFGFIDSYIPSITNLLTVMDVSANYAACRRYFKFFNLNDETSLRDISLAYTGMSSLFYIKLLGQANKLSKELLSGMQRIGC